MDVGLNNKNTLGEIAPEFEDVVFFVEATSTERHSLWSEWSNQSMSNIELISDEMMNLIQEKLNSEFLFERISKLNRKVKENNHQRFDWEQIYSGFTITIGHIEKLPVCLSFSFVVINGKKVCFYEATSQAVNHKMIKDWLISRFQLTHDNYSRWNHTDAMNFHNCIHNLDSLDEKPRNTIYKIEK